VSTPIPLPKSQSNTNVQRVASTPRGTTGVRGKRITNSQITFARQRFTELDDKYGSRCYLEVEQLKELWQTLIDNQEFLHATIREDAQALGEFIPQLIQEHGESLQLNFKVFLNSLTSWQTTVIETQENEAIAEELGKKALTSGLSEAEEED